MSVGARNFRSGEREGTIMKTLAGIIAIAVLAVSLAGGVFWTHRSSAYPVMNTPSSEMEEASHIGAGSGEMQDSCVPPYPFDLPTLGPAAC